jgi:putative transposase
MARKRHSLAIRVNRKLNSTDVIDVLSDLFIMRGVPGHVRSDSHPCYSSARLRTLIPPGCRAVR